MPDSNDANKKILNKELEAAFQLDPRQINEQVLLERLDTAFKQLAEKQTEVERLQNQLNEAYTKGGADETLVRELEMSRFENRALARQAELKTDRVIELEGSLEISARELNRAKIGLEAMEVAYIGEQELKNQLQNQLQALEQKTQASFEMADISQYLTGVINNFNEAVNTGDAAVNYIIRGLDVDMKAHIAKTEDNRMLMSAPSLTATSEEALSVIKFSIAAVPKDITSDEN